MSRRFLRITVTYVREAFPNFENRYESSFVYALVGLTEGNLIRMQKGIESLAEFHKDKSFHGLGKIYTGDMLGLLYNSGAISF